MDGANYKVIVEEQGPFWCMTATAPGRAQVRFSNVYVSAEVALEEAERFASLALSKWGIQLEYPIEWKNEGNSRSPVPKHLEDKVAQLCF
jgi:hypothetical protein